LSDVTLVVLILAAVQTALLAPVYFTM